MDKNNFIRQARAFVEKNQIISLCKDLIEPALDKALELDEETSNALLESKSSIGNFRNQSTLLVSRFNSLNADLAVLSQDEFRRENNVIKVASLNLIDQLSESEDFLYLLGVEVKSKSKKYGPYLWEEESKKERDFNSLLLVEKFAFSNPNQFPIIGLFDVGCMNPLLNKPTSNQILSIWKKQGRVKENDKSNKQMPNSYVFSGTDICCHSELTSSQKDFLIKSNYGISILVVQINAECVPDFQTLLFLDYYSEAFAKVPIIFVIGFSDEINIQSEKNIEKILRKHGFLLEQDGGEYQCQTISFSNGDGASSLIGKIFLELELIGMKSDLIPVK